MSALNRMVSPVAYAPAYGMDYSYGYSPRTHYHPAPPGFGMEMYMGLADSYGTDSYGTVSTSTYLANSQNDLNRRSQDVEEVIYKKPSKKSKKQKKLECEPVDTELSKTSICKFWQANKCKKANCPFAHGEHELKIKPDLEKTSWCKDFLKGTCTTKDCKFAHSALELRSTDGLGRKALCKFFPQGLCKNGEECRFLHPGVHKDEAEREIVGETPVEDQKILIPAHKDMLAIRTRLVEAMRRFNDVVEGKASIDSLAASADVLQNIVQESDNKLTSSFGSSAFEEELESDVFGFTSFTDQGKVAPDFSNYDALTQTFGALEEPVSSEADPMAMTCTLF